MPPKRYFHRKPSNKSKTATTTDDQQSQQQKQQEHQITTSNNSNTSPTPPITLSQNSFVNHVRRQMKRAAAADQQQQKNQNNDDENQSSSLLEQKLQQVKETLRVPDPEPFLVCCVINSVHNLRVVVDPKQNLKKKESKLTTKKASTNKNDDDPSSEEELEEEEENEFSYSDDPHVWDYSIWDCPRRIAASGKQRLYKFQQNFIERQKLLNEYRKSGELLASEAAAKRKSKLLKKNKNQNDEGKKKSNKNEDEEPKTVTVSSWNSIPAPPIISSSSHHQQQQTENAEIRHHPPPKKIPISPMPSCYLSTYDKDVNPFANQIVKETKVKKQSNNNDDDDYDDPNSNDNNNNQNLTAEEKISLAYKATAGVASTATTTNNTSSSSAIIVDRPPSRVTYDPSRYAKIVSQSTVLEAPHPALVDMAMIFNKKIEISCMLTAPTMYQDMPSVAESQAMHEAESEHMRSVPSTMEVLAKALPTSAIPTFPSAAKLRAYAAGAMVELKNTVNMFEEVLLVNDNKKKLNLAKNDEDQNENEDNVIEKKESETTKKRNEKPKKRHYAALLKLHFSASGNNHNDLSKSCPEYSSNSNQGNSAGSMINLDVNNNDDEHNHHQNQLLLSREKSFTIVHCLGPVQFLPPVDSALFVPRAPSSMSLVISEVPDPELHPAEKILLRCLLDFLETDEYNGSTASTLLQNVLRDTPQYEFVLGDLHENWSDFINAHANIEFATFAYSEEEVADFGLSLSALLSSSTTMNQNNSSSSSSSTIASSSDPPPPDEKKNNNSKNNKKNNKNKESSTPTPTTPAAASAPKPPPPIEHPSQNFEHMAKAFPSANEIRLVAWKNVHTFMEGDYARWATKMENERRVVDVMQSMLCVRPYDQTELIKMLGHSRAFVSLTAPCVKRMVDQFKRDPRYVVLQSRLHPLTVEVREDLVELARAQYLDDQQKKNKNDNEDDEEEVDLTNEETKIRLLRKALNMETYD